MNTTDTAAITAALALSGLYLLWRFRPKKKKKRDCGCGNENCKVPKPKL